VKQAKRTDQVNRIRRTIILAAFVVLAIGIATAVLIYGNTRAPFRAAVLEVNDTSIKMKYFLKRLSLARTNSRAMLQTLANEQIIKQTAPQPPYGIRISDSDIDGALEEAARRQGSAADEQAFDTWYREQLKQTGFSDAEYRDLVRTNLLTQRVIQYLAERVPTVAEQVHLYMISQSSIEETREVKRRLDAGEDFYTLAREVNVDEELKARGGDLGWFPRSGLAENLARTAFDELEIGKASEPLVFNEQLVAIILVAERAAARQIEEEMLQSLKSRVLEEWLTSEIRHHRVVVHGLKNGFDAETEAWVQWQLQKMRKE
jgi:parvulin-like peptidyl-prolyl isomerase